MQCGGTEIPVTKIDVLEGRLVHSNCRVKGGKEDWQVNDSEALFKYEIGCAGSLAMGRTNSFHEDTRLEKQRKIYDFERGKQSGLAGGRVPGPAPGVKITRRSKIELS